MQESDPTKAVWYVNNLGRFSWWVLAGVFVLAAAFSGAGAGASSSPAEWIIAALLCLLLAKLPSSRHTGEDTN